MVWATALRARYESDLYFRTSVNIITLQVGFVVLCAAAFVLSLMYPAQGWYIFGGGIIVALGCGIFLARFTLEPARNTARYQKLFISNIAHELRTPLSTIKTSSEVALIDDTLDPEIRKTFTEIVQELNRVSEIINNLLSLNTLTRPERMQFASIDIAPLAERVIERHRELAQERGIAITFREEPGSLVWGNTMALEQVMMNLVKNALLYTPAHSKGQVSVSVRPDSGMVLFGVTDSGIGIAQEDLLHIFEPFYRADSSRSRGTQQTGSGLGLTIVNEMVRAHRGRIHIESHKRRGTKPGGTTVSVFLPRGVTRGADEARRDYSEATFDFTAHSGQS